MYRNVIKKLFDLILAIFLLLFFLPIILIIYLILLIQIGSPIFFQKRPGLNNRIFVLYKFKTILDKNCIGFKRKKQSFKFGSFLRNTGLDELPQLLNILKGELSLVGPRPLRIKYLKITSFKKHVRNRCKPGLTGLAQIESYKKIKKNSWKKNFKLDEYYYHNISFILDLKILILTFLKIIKFSKKKDFKKEKKLLEKYIS